MFSFLFFSLFFVFLFQIYQFIMGYIKAGLGNKESQCLMGFLPWVLWFPVYNYIPKFCHEKKSSQTHVVELELSTLYCSGFCWNIIWSFSGGTDVNKNKNKTNINKKQTNKKKTSFKILLLLHDLKFRFSLCSNNCSSPHFLSAGT